MPKLGVLDFEGNKVEEKELREDIFEIEPNKDLMFRYVDMQQTNKRSGTASTKTRSEVRGGGRKPWPQKHMGRARAGSLRSPLFVGGGKTFGPKPKKYKKLNKSMKKNALKSALSQKFKEGNLIILDNAKIERAKTKEVKKLLNNLQIENTKILFLLGKKEKETENFQISAKNITSVKVIIADNPGQNKTNVDGLNVYDLINNEKVVMTKDLVDKVEEVLG